MDIKKLIQILSAVFVAAIFIASYASFGNNGSNLGSSGTTTTVAPQTVYGSGNANAMVTGYGPTMSIFIKCNSLGLTNSTVYNVSLMLSNLEANNNVSNSFQPNQTTFTVYTGKLNSYQLANYLSTNIGTNSSACLSYKGQTNLELPSNVMFAVQGQRVSLPIPQNLRNLELFTALKPINSQVPLRISALLTSNGMIFGNLSITQLGGG
ncbi:MAG: hypothetical protein KGH54_03040 [Candidatus Micrarchaeota archaeon]|nr:hypothetical protein [Candidatus Micrarchaeota archaeon]